MSSPTYESGSGSLFEPENITSDKLLHKCHRNKGKGQHEDAQDGNNLDDTVVLKVNMSTESTHDFDV